MKEYDPLSGEMFVFLNRRRMQMKIWYGKAVDSCYTTSGWNQGCLSNRRQKVQEVYAGMMVEGVVMRADKGANGSVFRRQNGHEEF